MNQLAPSFVSAQLPRRPQQVLGDIQQVNLAGAFVDPGGADVAIEALDAASLDVALAAEDLDDTVGDTASGVGREAAKVTAPLKSTVQEVGDAAPVAKPVTDAVGGLLGR